ncbi:MAG: NAD(P)/FAD-dependent oxidoreductase [Pirellulales bacterium]
MHLRGIDVAVVEASDDVGGRVRTDQVDGFLLDRGFQVLQTAYPEAQRVLDYAAMDLKPFEPGALVRNGDVWARMSDPWRRPWQAIGTAFSGIVDVSDFWKLAKLRRGALAGTIDELWSGPETTTAAFLREEVGLSRDAYEKFFRPWFAGVFFEPELATTSRFFKFVFRMFASGDASLPATGMCAIPRQLAAALPTDAVRLNTAVESIDEAGVKLVDGTTLAARAVVLAVDGPAAAELSGGAIPSTAWRSTACCYFAAPHAPFDDRLLVLNGARSGPINNLCVPSNVARDYAPEGQALISVSVVETDGADAQALTNDVRTQLRDWYGAEVDRWSHLRTDMIRRALPAQPVGNPIAGTRNSRLGAGLYVCGDYRESASIHGALVSGRRAAEAVLADLTSGAT